MCRSALNRKTHSREHRLCMDSQIDLQANCSYTATTHGQAYCDAFSAARTDYYQVNDLTAVLSTQRVL